MQKQYQQRLADEATERMVAPIPTNSGVLPTPPKSPSIPPTSDSNASTSNHHPPPEILPSSSDPKPQESAPSKNPKPLVVSEERTDNELSDLSEPDEELQLSKSMSKKGCTRKAISKPPLPPKKAKMTHKRK
jgi:hypothetical protein